MAATVGTAVSRDGATIGFRRSGMGRPLVLVHGSPADHTSFEAFIEHLEPHANVCAMDRRGRGMSSDGPAYAHAREYEDVAAVVDALGSGVDVFGHSYGAVIALEAARLTENMRRLVLYEPWVGRYPAGAVEELEQFAAAGDRDGVLTTILVRLLGMAEEEVDGFRQIPSWWDIRLALADVTVREAKAEDAYEFDASRFDEGFVPTLLLVGGDSPANMQAVVDEVAQALPDSRVEVLPGQAHIAHREAPDLLASHVLAFLAV